MKTILINLLDKYQKMFKKIYNYQKIQQVISNENTKIYLFDKNINVLKTR